MAKGKAPLETLDVHLAAIRSLQHACDCCAKGTRCCCSNYEVCVTAKEMERAIGVMPTAAKYAPHLAPGEEFENPFDETDDGLYSLDTHDDGLCVFAYHADGKTLCSLHTAAVDLGLPWHAAKPGPCILWPMALSEGKRKVLTIDGEVDDFHCNERVDPPPKALPDAFAEPVEILFGETAAAEFKQAASDGVERTRIAVEDRPGAD